MSMTREQIMHYLGNPDQLNEKTLIELREILDEYPYFQSAHLLYIRNLSNEKNFRFASQLKVTSVHTTDRTILYNLLNPKEKSVYGEVSPDVFPVDSARRQAEPSEELKNQSDREKRRNSIFMESSYRLEGEIDPDKSLAQLVRDINEAAINRNVPDSVDTDSDDKDEFITETLAKIYIKQGLYNKAIDAFKRLTLKYPEKSIYFAQQIIEVTNLLKK